MKNIEESSRIETLEKKVAVILGDPTKKDIVKRGGKFNPEDLEVVEILKQALGELNGYQFVYLDEHATLFEDLKKLKDIIDYALNFCDEGFNNSLINEGDIPKILERSHIPYTGADAKCMRRCFDKEKATETARKLGIPVPKTCLYNIGKWGRVNIDFFPVFVKPACSEGSFGINGERNVANNERDIDKIVKEILEKEFNYYDLVLIQEFLEGEEFTQTIIGNPGNYTIIPATQETFVNETKIQTYGSKWNPDSPEWKAYDPKKIKTEFRYIRKSIEDYSKRLFEAFDCRDYARFDWKLDSAGMPRFLEANPNCGWTNDGHMAKACKLAGIKYHEMLRMILQSAEKRLGLFQ